MWIVSFYVNCHASPAVVHVKVIHEVFFFFHKFSVDQNYCFTQHNCLHTFLHVYTYLSVSTPGISHPNLNPI